MALLIKSILIEKRKSRDEFGNEIEDEAYKSVLNEVEFDFYINGEFLDSTLDRFMATNTQIKTVRVLASGFFGWQEDWKTDWRCLEGNSD